MERARYRRMNWAAWLSAASIVLLTHCIASHAQFMVPAQLEAMNNFATSLNVSLSFIVSGILTDRDGMVRSLLLYSEGLSGELPSSVSALTRLTYLDLGGNKFNGTIPAVLGNLTSLQHMDLHSNSFTGGVPESFSALTNLDSLLLSGNKLSGPVPQHITKITTLTTLDLGGNDFNSPVPPAIGNLTNLWYFNIGNNRNVGGIIPDTIGRLSHLTYLGLDNTSIQGTIPPMLGKLYNLVTLVLPSNVSCPKEHTPCEANQLFASRFCITCHVFCQLCVKSSSPPLLPPLQAAPPPPPIGIPPVSPSPSPPSLVLSPPTPPPSSGPSMGLIIGIAVGASVLVLGGCSVLLLLLLRYKQTHGKGSSQMEVPKPEVCRRYKLETIRESTDGWAPANVLGNGGFGTVYRGVDPENPEIEWAVKRAKLLSHEFRREVEAMAVLRHPNLVRLLGYCIDLNLQSERHEQVIVYEYVANGDLACLMEKGDPLTMRQRMDVLLGVARGLEYLHSNGLVHRDIKPANILLGKDMLPKIADFGLVRVVEGSALNTTQVVGTPGYVDPAYIGSHIPSASIDVYCFGVVMLELLTGRSNIIDDEVKPVHIKEWVEPKVRDKRVMEFVDPTLHASDDLILPLAELALRCTAIPTSFRPQMRNVVAELESLRSMHVGRLSDRHSCRIDQVLPGDMEKSLDERIAEINLPFLDSPVSEDHSSEHADERC